MNGNNFLCDTNILLYLLNGDQIVSDLIDKRKIFISFITEIELLSFKKLSQTEYKIIKELISDCTLIDLNREIKEKAIAFRQKYNLKIPDTIIAATSDYLKIPLISADKQFKKIKDINLIFYQI
jgi:hypothetical protein